MKGFDLVNQMANQIPAPGDVPLHPSLVTGDGATPPQARVEQGGVHPNSANERHTTPASIALFFSPERYKGKQVTSEVRAGNTIKQHTTRENILAFFLTILVIAHPRNDRLHQRLLQLHHHSPKLSLLKCPSKILWTSFGLRQS